MIKKPVLQDADESEILSIGCVRDGVVVNVIRATREFAATLDFDVVGIAELSTDPVGWLIDGVFYPDGMGVAEIEAARQQANEASAALLAYNALTAPTNTETVAVVKLLNTLMVRLVPRSPRQ